jgi:hypothetical protein
MFHVNPSEVHPMDPLDVKNRPDLTLDDFIQWMEGHDPNTHYSFLCFSGGCLMGQYMACRGIPWGRGLYGPTIGKVLGFNQEGSILARSPNTFGAALGRAKALRESRNVA